MAVEHLPAHIGRYRVLARLGCGGMAEVFLAEWQAWSARRHVAIKRLLPHLATDAEYVELLQREVACCARMEHEHIVRLYDADDDNGTPYLVLEYVDGCTLHDLLCDGPLSTEITAMLATQLCMALDYAHSSDPPVVHRDISPQNILVARNGVCKLTDFGIARLTSRQTRTQNLRGKIAYMAPEQIRAHQSSPASDRYALGLVLYEAACGVRAYPETSDTALIQAVADNHWRQDNPAWQSLPETMRMQIAGLLAEDPQARPLDLQHTAAVFGQYIDDRKQATHAFSNQVATAQASRNNAPAHHDARTLTLPRRRHWFGRRITERAVLLLIVLLAGCGQTAGSLAPKMLLDEKPFQPAQQDDAIAALAIAVRGPTPKTVTAPVNTGQATVPGLAPGDYSLYISAVSNDGTVPYRGHTTATVRAGRIAPVTIQLEATP